jgi:predicted polyphosphate/ATP-dependent NAD kinase
MRDKFRLGLIVNPIAGMGGSVGLKGTDGAAVLAEARARGAEPRAPERAITALAPLAALRGSIELLAAPGAMGETEARAAGLVVRIVGEVGADTTAEHTRRAALAMAETGLDLLLFAGGDGTARDIQTVLDSGQPALGIPCGVKMHSAIYATSPRAAGDLAARHLHHPLPLRELEVMDIDEAAYRAGSVSAPLYGYLRVPYDRALVQGAKIGRVAGEAAALAAIAAEVIGRLPRGRLCILGPGTTARAIADAIGVPKTLLGVDLIRDRGVIAADAGERDLLASLAREPAVIVVTPIGGQGHIFGRGNQQLSPAVLRRAGLPNLMVVATPEKLASLHHQALRVDTGDAELDRALCGWRRVITGYGSEAVCRVTI